MQKVKQSCKFCQKETVQKSQVVKYSYCYCVFHHHCVNSVSQFKCHNCNVNVSQDNTDILISQSTAQCNGSTSIQHYDSLSTSVKFPSSAFFTQTDDIDESGCEINNICNTKNLYLESRQSKQSRQI